MNSTHLILSPHTKVVKNLASPVPCHRHQIQGKHELEGWRDEGEGWRGVRVTGGCKREGRRGARVMGGCKRDGWRGGGMRVRGARVTVGRKMEGWRGGGMRCGEMRVQHGCVE